MSGAPRVRTLRSGCSDVVFAHTGRFESATTCAVGAAERTVGVRELRQNLSVYLRRVAEGKVFAVTDDGRPVAMLAPLPQGDALDRLIALGLARPAEGDLLDLGPPPDVPSESGLAISEALQQQRGPAGIRVFAPR